MALKPFKRDYNTVGFSFIAILAIYILPANKGGTVK